MHVEAVKQIITEKYPGVNIKETTITDDGEVTELVGEFDRKLIGSDIDVAICVADRSGEHRHLRTTEEYEVVKGGLRVYRDGEPTDLKEGDRITIDPEVWHWVEGDETWFYCYSKPDWTPGDFYPREVSK